MFYEDQHKLAAYLERNPDAEFEYTNLETAPLGNESVWLKPHTSADSYVNHPLSRFFIRPVLRYNLPSHLQSEIHNPDNLTEAQICEGGKYRAVTKGDSANQPNQVWTTKEFEDSIEGFEPFGNYGFTYRLRATVPWPDWKQEDTGKGEPNVSDGHTWEGFEGGCSRFNCGPNCSPTNIGGDNFIDPKDARIAELENLLKVPEGLTRYVKELEAQLATYPWRRMSEVPTEEDCDEKKRIIVRDTDGNMYARSLDLFLGTRNDHTLTAWMPVPKFHGWPDPLADLLKAHGVAVTPEILAALNAWKGVGE